MFIFLDRLHIHVVKHSKWNIDYMWMRSLTLSPSLLSTFHPVPKSLVSYSLWRYSVHIKEILALSARFHLCLYQRSVGSKVFHLNRARGKLPRGQKSKQVVVYLCTYRMENCWIGEEVFPLLPCRHKHHIYRLWGGTFQFTSSGLRKFCQEGGDT